MRCFCGAGVRMRGSRLEMVAHSPNCLWLAWVVTLKTDGYCPDCGERRPIERSGPMSFQRCKPCGWSNHAWQM
jgi:hypothetical protein